MSISGYQEQVFWHYILQNQVYLSASKPEYFTNQTLRELFDIAKDHTLRYKEPPSKEQTLELVRVKGLSEKYSEDVITSLYNTKNLLAEYDSTWLEENVGPWIKVRNLDHVIRKVIAYMKITSASAENATEVVENVRHMFSSETAIDFSFGLGSDFFDPLSHKQTRLARTPTGYDYVDLCMKGGYWKGSLIGFLGGPKCGKSLFLCNLAAKSVQMGHNTAYLTFELQEELVHMRIGSNLLNVHIDEYEKLTEDQDLLKKMLNDLRKNSFTPMGNLYVAEFPSSTASVNDIKYHLKKTQEILGYKFDNIFVDYINIMKNWRNPNTENTYMKIKQISEDLRAMAMEEQWAVITVTQTNRCLHPNTIVIHREKGKIKLKNVKEGDYILGNDGYKKIKNKWNNEKTKTYKIKTKSGKEIIASANHIFPVNNSFQQLSNISIGDMLYVMENNDIKMEKIISIEEYDIIDTIDIELDSENKLFFANDILTHNSGWETSDLNITNIAESAALLHTVDMLFGIITNAEMKARREYFLKCLANRVAGYENTRKRYTVDWNHARIEEDKESQIQDMDFLLNNVIGGHTTPRRQSKKGETPSIHAVIGSNPDPDKDVNITGRGLFS